MAEYRYWATHVRTGAVLADWLPLDCNSFSRRLCASGDLTATLDLRASATQNRAYLDALEPRRTMLWVGQDGAPIWAGIVWDWPHSSILDYSLPIRASSIESLFGKREIRADLQFTSIDLFDIARGLVTRGTTGTGKNIAGLVLPQTMSGATRSTTYVGAENRKILDVLQGLASSENFEFTFEPGFSDEHMSALFLRLGRPQLGLSAETTPIVLQFPGNVVDYSFPRVGSDSVNSFRATATSSSTDGMQMSWVSDSARGRDFVDIAAGFPVLEDSGQFPGGIVQYQSQVDTFADTMQRRRARTVTVPTVTVPGPVYPRVQDIPLGSWAWLVASSPLHPEDPETGQPGLATRVRIIGWTVTPPGEGREETTKLHLGEVEDDS
ncbi:hypothetical protein [Parafrankia discariae]|uniref:hypothetical protein n=1 Tax=Parafrankia discariae TaxID=365528 RepID=UPI000379BC22|nr:hypothetical protein [Parafrankia discariae]